MNKNNAARLRRAGQALDKVLDHLNQAQGGLYPAELKSYREQIQDLIRRTEKLVQRVEADTPPPIGGRPQEPGEPETQEPEGEAA
jgi:hypothetical protein